MIHKSNQLIRPWLNSAACATAEQCRKTTSQPRGLITIHRNQSQTVETMIPEGWRQHAEISNIEVHELSDSAVPALFQVSRIDLDNRREQNAAGHRVKAVEANAVVKNVWRCTSTPLTSLYAVDGGQLNTVQLYRRTRTFIAYEAPCPETFWTNPPTALVATCRGDVPLEGVVT